MLLLVTVTSIVGITAVLSTEIADDVVSKLSAIGVLLTSMFGDVGIRKVDDTGVSAIDYAFLTNHISL
jgi:hypothetical protein